MYPGYNLDILAGKIVIQQWTSFILVTFKRFIKDRCDIEARSLSYITLLIVIPFFIVIVKGLVILKFYEYTTPLLLERISSFIIPDKARKVIEYFRDFDKIGKNIGLFNLIFVLLTSFWLFYLIVRNVNRIWKIKKKVNILVYLLKYLLFISIIPFILIILFYFQHFNFINKVFNIRRGLELGRSIISVPLNIIFHGLLLLFLFYVVPHKRLSLFYSFLSALISGVLLWIARMGFNLYLDKFSQMNVIYGSLVFIPVLLIWIYISWLILLFGLELNYSFHIKN